jgi:hypothetical protein
MMSTGRMEGAPVTGTCTKAQIMADLIHTLLLAECTPEQAKAFIRRLWTKNSGAR